MDMCVALIRGALLSLTNLIPQVQTLNEHLSNWRQLLADSIFVPVTGESRNITDSGNILAGYLRRELSVPQDNILTVDQLYDSAYSYQLKNSKRIILFDDLKLEFDNAVPLAADYQIAPLILIVFMENAFKHAKFIQSAAVNIYIKTLLQDNWFSLTIKNNYNKEKQSSSNGIGLTNVKRRLEVIYPNGQHQLTISQDEIFYTVTLKLQLVKIGLNN
jgi:LytS/YehU family sensor histidine kinase